MILTLEVISEQAQDLGARSRKVFHAVGGTIGRLPDNDWVFADPYVSGRHALIRYLSGKYFIEDTSTNGVFVNSPDRRLSRADSHQLRDGDVLFIDTYQIKVSLAQDPAAAQRNDPLALLQARHDKSAAGARQAPPPSKAAGMPRAASSIKAVPPSQSPQHSTGTQWFAIGDMASQIPPNPDAEPRAPIEAAGQAAFRSAMRQVFESLLSQLDPQLLQLEFDRQIRQGPASAVPAKVRYWELYREKYAALAKDPDGTFRKLFDDAFGKAFDEELQRQQEAARSRDE